tara:strand:- start:242268 stop:243587 length:1320 start_codon:yes stop_codon:yes gene_type:complete
MARLMFVLCCALPTAMTVSVILFTKTPWYYQRCLAEIEAELSDETGLIVRIDDFRRSTPSSLCLSGVSLLDPETEAEIARVHQIDWARKHDEIVFVLRQPELQSAELRHVYRLIHDRFLCRPDQTRVPVRVLANDLTIHSRTGPLTLLDIDANVTPQARRTVVNVVGVLAERHVTAPIKLHFTRDRREEVPTTTWILDAPGTALPCSALAECFPIMHSLGADATFAGVITYSEQPDGGASLDLSGSRFSQVELSRLFETLPHKLTGTADLELVRCLVGPDGTLIDFSGQFYARSGLLGGSLLSSLSQNLNLMVPAQWVGSTMRELNYDRIAVSINIRGEELELTGICNNERSGEYLPKGTMLSAGGEPLVLTSEEPMPVIQLVNAFSPSHSVLVPLSEQTSVLARFFKAPSRVRDYDQDSTPHIISAAPPTGGPQIKQR